MTSASIAASHLANSMSSFSKEPPWAMRVKKSSRRGTAWIAICGGVCEGTKHVGATSRAYRNEGADDEGVVVAKHDVVGALEAHPKLRVAVLLRIL